MVLLFLSAMLMLLIVGLVSDCKWLTGTVAILLANWSANLFMGWFSGDPFPWLFSTITDYLSAIAIFAMRRTRTQIFVVAIYAIQLIAHAHYGFFTDQGKVPQWAYYWQLSYTAWGQLAVLTGGYLYALHRRYYGAERSVSHTADMLGRAGKGDL